MPILIIIAIFSTVFLIPFELRRGASMKSRIFGLIDIEPENQGGSFRKDYDMIIETVADEENIPFALLKAHGVIESSLNPRAFTDENPTGRSDRQGWASRGLMQVLWWPNSDRFKSYGFPDVDLANGELLFDPYTNVHIAAKIIKRNLNACGGNLQDAINMYNTGKKYTEYRAPNNYTSKVLSTYKQLIKEI